MGMDDILSVLKANKGRWLTIVEISNISGLIYGTAMAGAVRLWKKRHKRGLDNLGRKYEDHRIHYIWRNETDLMRENLYKTSR